MLNEDFVHITLSTLPRFGATSHDGRITLPPAPPPLISQHQFSSTNVRVYHQYVFIVLVSPLHLFRLLLLVVFHLPSRLFQFPKEFASAQRNARRARNAAKEGAYAFSLQTGQTRDDLNQRSIHAR